MPTALMSEDAGQPIDRWRGKVYDIDCTIGTNKVNVFRGLVTAATHGIMMTRLGRGLYGPTADINVTRVLGTNATDWSCN